MSVTLIANPSSGRGLARRCRDRFDRALRDAGYLTRVLELDPFHPAPVTADAVDGAEAFVVFGGDGTIHHLADLARRSGVPVYHAPTGNENLFAREFGMTRDPRRFLAALRRRQVRRVDVGLWNGRGFLIMASTGVDASIIHRLGTRRSWTVGHLAYTAPILAESFNLRAAVVTVEVDGRIIADRVRGLAVVANSRHYGGGLNLAGRAEIDDGLLDAVVLPHDGPLSAIAWAARASARRHRRGGRALTARGQRIRLTTEPGAYWQLDGEAVTGADDQVVCEVRHADLPVLIPPPRRR